MVNNQSVYANWDYAIDSSNDSIYDYQTGIITVGGTPFEIYGIAVKETADKVYFAINANLPLGGQDDPRAKNDNIAWGDLILNFTNPTLNAADSKLFGISFAANDTSAGRGSGLFGDVSSTSVVNTNAQLPRIAKLGAYNDFVSDGGGTPSNGDLSVDDPYFNLDEPIRNVIQSGTRLGDVTLLSAVELGDLNFGTPGLYTIGFSVDRSLLPAGEFTMHLAPECGNDVIALRGKLFEAPAIDIEKKTNLIDIATPDEAIVLQPGTPIIWTYEVTNTGGVPFSLSQVQVTDDKVSNVSFLSSSDVNQDQVLSPGEKWIYAASGVAEALSISNSPLTTTVNLGFETDGAGNPLPAGTFIDDEYQAKYGLTISSIRLGRGTEDPNHRIMIFDSANPTGGDYDLGTPNQYFGGPGISKDGTSPEEGNNRLPLGNLLIISQNNNANDPNDNATGGIIRFDWQNPAQVNYLDILDVDKGDTRNKIRTYDAAGNLIAEYAVRPIGDNAYQRVLLGGELASRLEMIFDPSADGTATGAIANISFTQSQAIYQNVGTVTIAGLETVTDSDTSYYRNGDTASFLYPPGKVDYAGEDDLVSDSTPSSSQSTPLKPGKGGQWLEGQAGRDSLRGGSGNDTLIGNVGHDLLWGKAGRDLLRGGKGNDELVGGSGQDTLNGDGGKNQLVGGKGRDCFVFSKNSFSLVQDFQYEQDVIMLKGDFDLEDIDILQRGSNTVIRFEDQTIAKLKGISSDLISLDNFQVAS